jgi:mRNA interferase MazF
VKIEQIPERLGSRVGCLDDENMVRLNQAMMLFLCMAVSPKGGGK